MALPAHVLERLSPIFSRYAANTGLSTDEPTVLRLGADLDAALPGGGFLRGGVVELSVKGAGAQATSIALQAIRAAQAEAESLGGDSAWCAFIDASATLHAPGVASAGVRLDRLLVVQPPLEALSRVALRVVESRAFAVVAVDLMGTLGGSLDVHLGAWERVVRRLALAVEGSSSSVVLLTDALARRPLPLPVAQRIELGRTRDHKLLLHVKKDRRGRVSGPTAVRVASKSTAKPALESVGTALFRVGSR